MRTHSRRRRGCIVLAAVRAPLATTTASTTTTTMLATRRALSRAAAFTHVLVVDWSASGTPVTGANSVHWCLCRVRDGAVLHCENPATRGEAARGIRRALDDLAADGETGMTTSEAGYRARRRGQTPTQRLRRELNADAAAAPAHVLLGVDFSLAFPRGTFRAFLHHEASDDHADTDNDGNDENTSNKNKCEVQQPLTRRRCQWQASAATRARAADEPAAPVSLGSARATRRAAPVVDALASAGRHWRHRHRQCGGVGPYDTCSTARPPLWRVAWTQIARRVHDDVGTNANNRFAVAAALNARISGRAYPFWGRPLASSASAAARSASHDATLEAYLSRTKPLVRKSRHQSQRAPPRSSSAAAATAMPRESTSGAISDSAPAYGGCIPSLRLCEALTATSPPLDEVLRCEQSAERDGGAEACVTTTASRATPTVRSRRRDTDPRHTQRRASRRDSHRDADADRRQLRRRRYRRGAQESFKLFGAGAVGSQALLGIALMERLRHDLLEVPLSGSAGNRAECALADTEKESGNSDSDKSRTPQDIYTGADETLQCASSAHWPAKRPSHRSASLNVRIWPFDTGVDVPPPAVRRHASRGGNVRDAHCRANAACADSVVTVTVAEVYPSLLSERALRDAAQHDASGEARAERKGARNDSAADIGRATPRVRDSAQVLALATTLAALDRCATDGDDGDGDGGSALTRLMRDAPLRAIHEHVAGRGPSATSNAPDGAGVEYTGTVHGGARHANDAAAVAAWIETVIDEEGWILGVH